MPCSSEHMKPNDLEVEHSKLLLLIKELNTGEFIDPDMFGDGFDKAVYGKSNKETVDKLTETLCDKLQKFDDFGLSERSLELQMWWRDHQEHDKIRIERSLDIAPNGVEFIKIYNSLDEYELSLIDKKYSESIKKVSDEEKYIISWLTKNLPSDGGELDMNAFLLKFGGEFIKHFNYGKN